MSRAAVAYTRNKTLQNQCLGFGASSTAVAFPIGTTPHTVWLVLLLRCDAAFFVLFRHEYGLRHLHSSMSELVRLGQATIYCRISKRYY